MKMNFEISSSLQHVLLYRFQLVDGEMTCSAVCKYFKFFWIWICWLWFSGVLADGLRMCWFWIDVIYKHLHTVHYNTTVVLIGYVQCIVTYLIPVHLKLITKSFKALVWVVLSKELYFLLIFHFLLRFELYIYPIREVCLREIVSFLILNFILWWLSSWFSNTNRGSIYVYIAT